LGTCTYEIATMYKRGEAKGVQPPKQLQKVKQKIKQKGDEAKSKTFPTWLLYQTSNPDQNKFILIHDINGAFMKKTINKTEAAKILGMPAQTLELWMSKKFGPTPTWFGKLAQFDRAEVEAFAQKLKLKDGSSKPPARKNKKK
jgi:hypothetical protein